ncbi:MAG: GMC family oxidoreductase N-terminal domain-containing protein, partial [Flavisolibacter sp.]
MLNSKSPPLTPQELRLKTYVRILFFIYLGGVLLYSLPAILGVPSFLKPYNFISDPAFANNSTIKMGLFAVLCFLASGNIRKYLVAVEAIIVTMLLGVVSGLLLVFFARNNYVLHMGGKQVPIRTMILYSTIFDAVLNFILIVLYRAAERARYKLAYFSPLQFRVLTALAEVVIQGEKELLTPREIAANVDRYMSSFKAKTKWVTRLAMLGIEIYPLFFLKPPTSFMRPDDRKQFLERHFYQDVSLRLAPPVLRMLVQAMIRMGKQLCFMGYYNDAKTFDSIGYIPFSKRANKEERMKKFDPPEPALLSVITEKEIQHDVYDWDDVVIIGSGPGASILAKGLVEKGRRVLLVERGDYVDPSKFTEDEIDMVSTLYADGALQLASDFRFQVIQGNTVGGSSVVNNAVCFDPPSGVLELWNEKNGLNAGLDLDRFRQCNKNVNQMAGVRKIGDTPDPLTIREYLNPGGKKFEEGCEKMKLNGLPNQLDAVAANICKCVGCGYCNIGCAYGRKLSMASNILPAIQLKHGSDKLKIIAGAEVYKIQSKGRKITSVMARFSNGRKLEIRGKTFVVSAGAISSSILLQRSGIATGRAGKNLCFNIGSPMNAVFPEPINAYDGLQISHFLQVNPGRGYIFETWFNPPMFQSTVMPG